MKVPGKLNTPLAPGDFLVVSYGGFCPANLTPLGVVQHKLIRGKRWGVSSAPVITDGMIVQGMTRMRGIPAGQNRNRSWILRQLRD